MRRLAWIFLFLFQSVALAEYRAFVLRIEKIKDPNEFREVVSTLDPLQYVGYFPVGQDERVTYTRTRMCWERTNDQPICPDPKAAPTTENQAP